MTAASKTETQVGMAEQLSAAQAVVPVGGGLRCSLRFYRAKVCDFPHERAVWMALTREVFFDEHSL